MSTPSSINSAHFPRAVCSLSLFRFLCCLSTQPSLSLVFVFSLLRLCVSSFILSTNHFLNVTHHCRFVRDDHLSVSIEHTIDPYAIADPRFSRQIALWEQKFLVETHGRAPLLSDDQISITNQFPLTVPLDRSGVRVRVLLYLLCGRTHLTDIVCPPVWFAPLCRLCISRGSATRCRKCGRISYRTSAYI